MKILSDVDGDEVSLVRRAANKRRFLLLKGDSGMDTELEDILDVPYEHEGRLLDAIRKEAVDPTTEQAFIYGLRLMKSVESELSPELVEKLGRELYPVVNNPINTVQVDSPGELCGDADGDEEDLKASVSGPAKDGSASGASLEGSGSAPKVAADGDDDDMKKDDDHDEDDVKKTDFSADQRKNLASQGKALPDGSFPIRNKSDLSNAIHAYGRAGDQGKAKSWITRRAQALGATSMLPDAWSVSKSGDEQGGMVEFRTPIQKEDGTWDFTDVPEDSQPFFKAMIEKADLAEKVQKSLDETREELHKSQDELRQRDYIAKADDFKHLAPADKLGMVLKNAAETMDAERYEELEQVLKSAQARVETGDLFAELGSRALEDPDTVAKATDPWGQIENLAKGMVEKSGEITQEQAIDRVLKTAEGKRLYSQYEHSYLSRVLNDPGASGYGGVA